MADRIKNYQQEADQITTLKAIRTDLGVTPSSYTPDATVVTKDRVVTFAQAEEELVVLSDIEKGVKQQIVDVDIAQKDISNIKSLLQGHLYDYQTDSTSAYTKSVPSGAMPYAGLEKVGGKTIVWNQLVDSGTTTVPTISGRKYYTLIDGTASIVTSSGSAISIVDDTADMVCDLTLMFGSGSEPSTTADFTAIFGATHYSYNAGTLLSAGVTSVVSNSNTNLLDPTQIVQGSIGGGGADIESTKRLRTPFIPVTAGETYTVSCKDTDVYSDDSIIVYEIHGYNANLTQVFATVPNSFSSNQVITNNAQYIKVLYRKYNNATITPDEIQEPFVAKGSNVPYVPDIIGTYSIPTAIRNIEGYGWSAGTVYNYVDFERKKFVKNVDRVVLNGTQTINNTNWTATENGCGWIYPYTLTNNKVKDYNDLPNIVSDKLLAKTYPELQQHNVGISTYNYNELGIVIWQNDISLNTATAINNYLSANPITVYYELATPQEIDISEYLTDDNLINVESGGTLTFPNSNGTDYQIPVPSEEEYMIDLQSAIGG